MRRSGFRDAKVDYARGRFAIDFDDENVGRLDVAMNDGLLMRVLYSFADFDEEFQPLPDFELLLIAVVGDGQAGYVLHHKVGLPPVGGASVEDFGDRRVVHDGQRLTLRAEALKQRVVVHAGLDEFEGDLALEGRGLFREPDLSHAAFAQFFYQSVGADRPGLCCFA